jgi:hypothetical protein
MKNFAVFLFVTSLASCDRGTPLFWHAPVERVVTNDIAFDVRRVGDFAQVERVTLMSFPRRLDVLEPALNAIRGSTGCRIKSVDVNYDPSIISVKLNY